MPGAIGRITELHATYYAQHWDLGLYFEAKVATELSQFMSRFQPEQDGAWFATIDDQIIGSIFIDGADSAGEGARLRWFIIDPTYQGRGLGQRLMAKAISFCNHQQFPRVYLTTFAGLAAARHLYEAFGFNQPVLGVLKGWITVSGSPVITAHRLVKISHVAVIVVVCTGHQ